MATYFALLLGIGWATARRADAEGYFLGNRRSRWWVVMVGLIGDSLSGVTFISVPGAVAATQFSYMRSSSATSSATLSSRSCSCRSTTGSG